ncbi:MAG: HlyD family efflux transporter periplasmic adaptor subunit [Planctomycetales bacterium]|nr:HlyD family efflux transporter periplasmic adaptor subunit [Planctomycetales bacterium]
MASCPTTNDTIGQAILPIAIDGSWASHGQARPDPIQQQLAALMDLVAMICSSESIDHACRRLAHELKVYTGARQVAIALTPRRIACGSGSSASVVAVSNVTQVDQDSPAILSYNAVVLECIARDSLGTWPPRADDSRHALFAHRQLSQLFDGHAVHSAPLKSSEGTCHGAIVLVAEANEPLSEPLTRFLAASSVPVGSALWLLGRAQTNFLGRWLSQLRSLASRRRAKAAVLLSCIGLCLAFFPMRYRVSCDCELQPVVRRFVAAPFDGRLQRSAVEPGDAVEAGGLLAEIDASDIQWELSAKQAEAHRVEKELAGYVVLHQSGQAEITKLELRRLQLQIGELEEQASNLQILSPIDGIVLLGDHAKLEGAPLEKGKTLFEIAPLDQMLVEIEIPEDDVRFVREGMSARVRLDSFPHDPIFGTIQRVHPRAELKDQNNVFIAEIACPNPHGKLKPGMRGQTRVSTELKPLVWIWLHKGYAKSLSWLGW